MRLTFSKWKGEGRDFLIKNADHYNGLSQQDLAILTKSLDAAHTAGIKVVIAPLSLPGCRWKQQNGNQHDDRLWQDKTWWLQAAAFWRDLASALKDHSAVAAYNLLNEPVPERKTGLDENADPSAQSAWYEKYRNTSHDLPAFYAQVIAAIREVDPVTPIMVDSGWYANARGFSYWPSALADTRTLYSFHMYEPYEATSAPNMKRKTPYRYPGVKLDYGNTQVVWDKAMLARHIQSTMDWAKSQGIPSSRIVAGEFGCMRLWQDAGVYLGDILDIFDSHQFHWAFYSFREDVWDGMDYELSPDVKPGQFYWLTEQGKASQLKRSPHPLFDIIRKHL